MKQRVWSVSSLVRYVKHSLDNDMNIQSIFIQGEISNFTHHRSNHLYFSLKDEGAKMNCVMFASHASKIRITPKEGMKVIVRANLSMYEPQGNIQLYITAMQSDGIGDLYLQFEELKAKLSKEGLFSQEHKKQIPTYPTSVGIISAKTGAAIQDVLSIIARRWPLSKVQVYPSLVQGDQASEDIIKALLIADTHQHDVILLVRGGGSIEDLWCFNNEMLARVIFDMKTCVVSGVGHESDTTLVDYVSDQRAPTPSAAAELVTPERFEVSSILNRMKAHIQQSMQSILIKNKNAFSLLQNKPMLQDKDFFIQQKRMQLDLYIQQLCNVEKTIIKNCNYLETLENKMISAMQDSISRHQMMFTSKVALMDAFSPLKILQRGYSITMQQNHIVKSIDDLHKEDKINIILHDGSVIATIYERKKNNE